MPYTYATDLTDTQRRLLLDLAVGEADRDAAPVPIQPDQDTDRLVELRYLDIHDYGDGPHAYLRDEAWRWITDSLTGTVLNGFRPLHADEAERAIWDELRHQQRRAGIFTTRPRGHELAPGRAFGQHCLPDRGDELSLINQVGAIFTASDDPAAAAALRRLFDYAPDFDRAGVADWGRALRADETAIVFGRPITELPQRRAWLERADEVVRAWGRPAGLFGPGSLTGQPLDEFL